MSKFVARNPANGSTVEPWNSGRNISPQNFNTWKTEIFRRNSNVDLRFFEIFCRGRNISAGKTNVDFSLRPTARIVFRLYGVRSTKWFQRGLRTAYSLVPRESELPNCTKPQGERSRNGWLPAHTRITARTTRPETNARTSTAGGRVPPAPSLQPGRGSNHKRSTSTASCRCAQ